ncbi:MAG TPA: VanW family protein [Candidatus Limnocylindrales bacterium]
MAIANDVLPTPDDAPTVPVDLAVEPVARRRRSRLKVFAGFVFGFAIGLALVAGGITAGLVAWDRQYEARVLPGVRIGDLDVSGMDRAQLDSALAARFGAASSGKVVIHTDAGDVTVPYENIARRVDTAALADAALAAGRGGTPAERALGQLRQAMDGVVIQPSLSLDPGALAAQVQAALAPLETPAVDATVSTVDGKTATTQARTGRTFDSDAVATSALALVDDLDAPASVTVEVASIPIPPAHGDDEAAAQVAAAQSAADAMVGRLVITFRDQKWPIKAATVQKWIRYTTAADGTLRPTVDATAINKALRKIAKKVKTPPLNAAYFKNHNGHVVGVAPAKNGTVLDAKGTAAAIESALLARTPDQTTSTRVAVSITKVPPKISTATAEKKGPLMTRLGSWKTWFPVSDHNFFGANIWRPAQIIDGTVLNPGQRFEWWSAIGPVSSSRGFGPGGFIAGDHTEPTGALGGGMCSSSTTLFNAAMRAGLQMGARSNHKYYIYRYPLGLDATVSMMGGRVGQTMSFTNDMKHPIVIRSYRYTAGGVGWVRYEIWGIPDGRTVSLSKPSVSNVLQSHTSTEYVSTLPRGVREQTEFPADGMDVSVSRVVRSAGGKIIHTDTWRSHYVLWNGIIQVGR